MKVEIKVPAMGESITEATIGTLLKQSGSTVKMDDEILELETEKLNQVLYAPESGVLTLNVNPEDKVKIGQVIGYIETEGAPSPKKDEAPPTPKAPPPLKKPEKSEMRKSKEDFVEELSKEPAQVVTPKPEMQRGETRKKMSKIRSVIARRMVEALQTTAMLSTFNEIDMSQVNELREKYKESFEKTYGVKLGYMSFFVKSCVSALQAFPDLNSYIDGEEIVQRNYYDIGIAVSTERGLLVPVVRDCDRLSFDEIEKFIGDLAKRAREGRLTADDLVGGGFTITNGGVFGSLLSTPILNPPQSGILGMHKILKRPVALDDQIVIRPMMYVALSYDHRIVDGKEAISFLVHIKNNLEDPSRMLLKI
jgi:2-oxoglutarate dehydrogenase E2 component (dihydrolipoamide succinyltransferase)